ncbi:unnamed protein product [Pleuronectes platessa]|uniref:Uncharacterized protein n=1 Tax=Pleuronectes platessa TaxID=8262 RepID=A0A9N7U454_PLEPL|nr:unnamed protein product [Pleuronectes platessa]
MDGGKPAAQTEIKSTESLSYDLLFLRTQRAAASRTNIQNLRCRLLAPSRVLRFHTAFIRELVKPVRPNSGRTEAVTGHQGALALALMVNNYIWKRCEEHQLLFFSVSSRSSVSVSFQKSFTSTEEKNYRHRVQTQSTDTEYRHRVQTQSTDTSFRPVMNLKSTRSVRRSLEVLRRFSCQRRSPCATQQEIIWRIHPERVGGTIKTRQHKCLRMRKDEEEEDVNL